MLAYTVVSVTLTLCEVKYQVSSYVNLESTLRRLQRAASQRKTGAGP